MTPRPLPPWVEALVSRFVRDPVARLGLLGDLEERYARRGGGRLGRARWLVTELTATAIHYLIERGRTASALTEEEDLMDVLRQDLHFAFRSMMRRPAFALLVVATLGLGIGSNTAIFSVVDGLLFEPLPYPEAERLAVVNQRTPEGFTASVSLPNYRDWKERARSFEALSAILPSNARLAADDGSRIVEIGWVHGGFFETMGVEPSLGRTFTEAESEPGAEAIVVLSHGFWETELGADPGIVGRAIPLRDAAWTVVGVMPPDFAPYGEVQAYLPMGYIADRVAWDDRGTGGGTVLFGRLAPGVEPSRAQGELTAIGEQIAREVGTDAGHGNLTPLRRFYLQDADRQAMLLMAAVALVLLVACANVANLLLVRGAARRDELGLRSALGAGRGRVYRQLLTESLAYGALGGLTGTVVGALGLRWLLAVVGDTLPARLAGQIGIDAGVLAFTVVVAIGTAVLAGFVPALRSSRTELADTLRESGRTVTAGSRTRGVLIGGEVALSMTLLVGAGLLIESLTNLQHIDKGFDGRDVLTLRLQTPDARDSTRELWTSFHEGLRERVRALPGVSMAASSQIFPLAGSSWEMLYRDENTPPGERGESVLLTMVSPEYFDTYGIEIVRGRGFERSDVWGGDPVVVVDETLAEARWPGADPIGRRVTLDQTRGPDGEMQDVWRTVVGVARHVRHYELASPSRIEAYTPMAQSAAWGFTTYLSVRADGVEPSSLVPGLRSLIAELDPDVALYRIRTLESLLQQELGVHRAMRQLFVIFAGLTLLLGAIGIYSVVSHATALRAREVGVRIALGGAPTRMVALMVRGSLAPVAVGLLAGVAGSAAIGRLLGSVLYEVRPLEPSVVAAAGGLLLVVAVVAAWLPARGAARVEPTHALRVE